jgi:cysteinyl-tRNA synthetase
MALKLFNTLTRKKEVFKPLLEKKVGMYSCGPTVYDFPHIGNYRAYIAADLLKRYLTYKGFSVKQIMNITDVDDKTIRGSQKEKIPLAKFTAKYEKAFFEDLETIGIKPASTYPKATEHINEMVALIKKLLNQRIAYKTSDGCIYFSISKFKNYGKLASINLEELQAGASGRMLKDEYAKEQAHDFALWKAWTEEDGAVFWETELGKGRPGWHIECSAMSMKYLGNPFDIHTGGVDLIFPHHQNEIAQSEAATGKKFVNFWLHNEWLLVEGKKMSKSLGNFYTLRDIIAKGYESKPIRFLLLGTHYRQQINFTFQSLDAAKNALQRIWDFVQKLDETKNAGESNEGKKEVQTMLEKAKIAFENAMDDDLDISKALASIFDIINKTNKMLASGALAKSDAEKIKKQMTAFDSVLGIIIPEDKKKIPAELKKLIDDREAARAAKDWKKADKLRDELLKKGIVLEDTADGIRWKWQ